MSHSRVIRYRTKPERAQENVELNEAVFAELAASDAQGIRYEAYRLDDRVTFVHVATLDGASNPLESSPAFAAFQSGLADRFEEGPIASGASIVGSHDGNRAE